MADKAIPDPFVWNDDFDVKHEGMNDQHKGLFEGIDDVCKNPNDGAKLASLIQKVVQHFEAEEQLMKDGPGLEAAHKAVHDEFVGQAGGLTCPVAAETQTFVK